MWIDLAERLGPRRTPEWLSGLCAGTTVFVSVTSSMVFGGVAGQWNDLNESNELSYLVEFGEQIDNSGDESALTSSKCPYGLRYRNSNGQITKAYSWCIDNVSYMSAQSNAANRKYLGAQGYLAVIETASENVTIRDWLLKSVSGATNYLASNPSKAAEGGEVVYVWLGADDKDQEGRWDWRQYPEFLPGISGQFWSGGSNGSAISGSYENWGTTSGKRTQPNNYQSKQDALAMALADFADEGASGTSGGGASPGVLRVALEEPVQGEIHTGVGNLRGWAVADKGITKVEILIDGAYAFDIPYGGSRGDVGSTFPDVPNSSESGFSAAFNYSSLSAGSHTISAIAYDESGATQQSSASFDVVRFNSEFISGSNAVNLNNGVCRTSGDEISIVDAIVSGELYDLVLKWRTAEQGFEIVEIR